MHIFCIYIYIYNTSIHTYFINHYKSMFLDINSHIEREREGLYHISAPVLGSVHKYSQTAHCGWHRPYPARQSLQLDKLTTVY